jgi:hypothetical protein
MRYLTKTMGKKCSAIKQMAKTMSSLTTMGKNNPKRGGGREAHKTMCKIMSCSKKTTTHNWKMGPLEVFPTRYKLSIHK